MSSSTSRSASPDRAAEPARDRPDAATVLVAAEALATIAPAGVRTGCRRIIAADVGALHPVEVSALRRAVPERVAAFASGRALLRELLGVDVAIPTGLDRAPRLPTGFVGTLSHTDRLAVAAVAPAAVVAAIGIDAEPVGELDADVADVVLRRDEVGIDAHLAFTLKEAVYKAWSGLGGGLLEHHEVRLTVEPDGDFTGVVVAAGTHLVGRWVAVAGHWLALVVVPVDPAVPVVG